MTGDEDNETDKKSRISLQTTIAVFYQVKELCDALAANI